MRDSQSDRAFIPSWGSLDLNSASPREINLNCDEIMRRLGDVLNSPSNVVTSGTQERLTGYSATLKGKYIKGNHINGLLVTG